MKFLGLAAILAVGVPEVEPVPGETITVYDFRNDEGSGPAGLAPLADQILVALQRRGFRTLGRNDIQVFLQHETSKDVLTCDDVTCLADIAQSLNSQWLVYGTATRDAGQTTAVAVLMNSRNIQVVRRVYAVLADGDDDRGRAALLIVRWLIGPFAELRVDSQPSGSTVFIDGQRIGNTPIRVSEVPLGVSVVRIELPGYLAAERRVELTEVNQLGVRELHVPLSSESSTLLHRIGGWTGLAFGFGSLVLAGAAYLDASDLQSNADTTYERYRATTNSDDAIRLHKKAANLDKRASTSRTTSLAALAAGTILGGVGGAFLLTAPDKAPVSIAVEIASTPNKVGLSLEATFPW